MLFLPENLSQAQHRQVESREYDHPAEVRMQGSDINKANTRANPRAGNRKRWEYKGLQGMRGGTVSRSSCVQCTVSPSKLNRQSWEQRKGTKGV